MSTVKNCIRELPVPDPWSQQKETSLLSRLVFGKTDLVLNQAKP